MKKTKIGLLLSVLLILSANLFAQNSEGRFKLKEGDWFEFQVNEGAPKSKWLHLTNIRYQLVSMDKNGNQRYQLTLAREKITEKSFNGDGKGLVQFGYDSYYPPFKENKKTADIKKQFLIEVSSLGRIVSLSRKTGKASSRIELKQISPKKRYNYSASYSSDFNDSLYLIKYSEILLSPVKLPDQNQSERSTLKKQVRTISPEVFYSNQTYNDSTSAFVPFIKSTEIPIMISLQNTTYMLSAASFAIPGNTIISGKIKNSVGGSVSIGNNNFSVNDDGSFFCPILLTQPTETSILIGSKHIRSFLEPGDTLYISINGKESDEKIQYSGTAAESTKLIEDISNLIPQFSWHREFDRDFKSFFAYRNTQSQSMNELLKKYEGKVSETCSDYIRTELDYYLAQSKFEFCENHIYGKFDDSPLTFADYPSDFFIEADTLPVLLNRFENGTYFNQFLRKSILIKQLKMSMSLGSRDMDDFMGNNGILRASLDGYPLYSQLYELLYNRLRNEGSGSLNQIKPYFDDFINNCANPSMVDSLKLVYENVLLFSPGKQFPLKSILTADNTKFSFEGNKGKVTCLYFCSRVSTLTRFVDEIKKFQSEDVEFIFVVAQNQFNQTALEKNLILSAPKTKIIFANEDRFSSLLPVGGLGRIFVLDKWFRIIDDNTENPELYGLPTGFRESIKKAIEAKRYSKAEKTAMIKNAGWSFGSILFTFMIGLWIYKIRVRRIKKQEATKRRMKELEIKAIRSQMNPHFIFNALNSIQSLINGNQFKEANVYLSKFAVLLRGVLNNSEKSHIPLSDELQAVELYCQLEQLRFEFKFEISIAPEVNGDLIEISGMIIQPLAENAVVHGLSGKGELGELDIQIKRQNGNLCVCVSDNGVGLTSQKIDELSQKGFGLKLVEERINILNLDGKEAKLTVENRQNTEGTIATLIIPID